MGQTLDQIDAAVRDCINYCGIEADLDVSLAEYYQYLVRTGWAADDIRLVLDRAERALRPIFHLTDCRVSRAG